MGKVRRSCNIGEVRLLLLLLLVSFTLKALADHQEKTTSPLFIFGDSTLDVGNNNYISTIPENQANYKPYGQNGFFQHPTGRFSDGRVIVDYIAEYAKLPLIPPFNEPSAECDYEYGVNFASGGAGVLPQTNQGTAIDLPTQLRNFEQVDKKLREKFGDAKAEEILREAVYFLSIGSNDYIGGYLGNPKMRESYVPQEFVGMVIGNLTQAIQVLYGKGGRKFGFLSLCPLGCLPVLRRLNEGGCLEAASALAHAHNNALQSLLNTFQQTLPGFSYCNSNFYDWLSLRINNPSNYGFKDGVNACCGSGAYGGIYTCGGNKKPSDFELCEDPEDYVWWDSFHPTEKIHEQFAKTMWSGPPSSQGSFNLRHLFSTYDNTRIADLVDVPQEHYH